MQPFTLAKAYFPPTFEADGMTHATAVPSRLLDVANHFYQERISESWVTWRYTLPETNSEFTPENGGPLEVRRFLWETSIFWGKLLVLGRFMGAIILSNPAKNGPTTWGWETALTNDFPKNSLQIDGWKMTHFLFRNGLFFREQS